MMRVRVPVHRVRVRILSGIGSVQREVLELSFFGARMVTDIDRLSR